MKTKNKKTFKEIRSNFWTLHPEFKDEQRYKKKHNDYNATIRSAFVEYIDNLEREKIITNSQANKITL